MTESAKTVMSASLAAALAAATLFAFASPAAAFWGMGGNNGDDNDIRVENKNNATVYNSVKVEAETGDNDADGGEGGEGGRGGDARGADNNTGGRGGNGGDGALGGYILTGDATAVASVFNEVNVNRTNVNDDCGCEEVEEDEGPWKFWGRRGGDDNDIRVSNTSRAHVGNEVEVEAETGENEADGGAAGDGARGGDAEGDEERAYRPMKKFFWWGGENDDDYNTGGNGGNGGNGGVGGEIYTGNSTAGAEVTNIVNRNVTRVERGR